MDMVKSFDRTTWKENPIDEHMREALNAHSDPALARRLYPFRAKAKKNSMAYSIKEGQEFEYARFRMEPQFYPITVVVGVAGQPGRQQHLNMTSDEVQMIEV